MEAIGGTRQFYIPTKRTDYELSKYSESVHKELCPKCQRNYKETSSPQCSWCARKEVAKRQRARRLIKLMLSRANVQWYFRDPEEEEPEWEDEDV